MSSDAARRYRAFISYSHRDAAWAAWLHRGLESYRIAPDLIGRHTATGAVPQSLRPVFRDRDDFAAGHSLNKQTQDALAASECLIVLCSPRAAASPYVNAEIRSFKAMGRADRVIPLIIDGNPGEGANDCFPPALRLAYDADGEAIGDPHEPIAADARTQGDGKERAKLKVIAAMLGVGLDEIVRRAETARRRKRHMWSALAAILVFLTVMASASAVYAWHQLQTNEAFLNSTLASATAIVDTAVVQAERYNVPRTATLELLTRAERLFTEMSRLGHSTPELRFRRAAMLIAFARNYAVIGNSERQRQRITEAYESLRRLVEDFPGRIEFEGALAAAQSEVANVLLAQGNVAEAQRHYEACVAVMKRLRNRQPDAVGWQKDLATAQMQLAGIFITQGRLAAASELLEESRQARATLVAHFPNDAELTGSLATSRAALCFVARVQRRHEEALAHCRAALELRQSVMAGAPSSFSHQAEVALSFNQLATVLAAQGDHQGALANQTSALALWQRIAASDVSNAGWQTQLAATYDSLGISYTALKRPEEALASLRQSLAIMQRLALSDPQNTTWQSDLAIVNGRIGSLLAEAGHADEAMDHYTGALHIFERLARADPRNMRARHDVFVAYVKLGELHTSQARPAEAKRHYFLALPLIEALVAGDPSNKEWLLDLIELNLLLARLGDDAPRRIGFVISALHNLRALRPLLPEHAGWLTEAEALIGDQG